MSRHAPNRQLSDLLAEANWSAGDLARAINILGQAARLSLSYDRTSVAHWLAGSRPRAPIPDLAARALSRRSGRVITPEDTGLSQSPSSRAARNPNPLEEGDPLRRLTALCRQDADPARRSPLTASPYTLAALTLPDWTPRPTSTSPNASERAVSCSSADVRILQEMAEVFASLCSAHGGGHARSALAAYITDDAERMLVAPATSEVHQHLCTAAAQLTHLLGVMTEDAGYAGLAQCYYRTALDLARQADDRATYAITLRTMSLQALSLGHPSQAHTLAQTALDTAGAGTTTAATRSFLLAQRALTYAAVRQPRRSRADLRAADRQHERASSPPGPFTSYPRAGLEYHTARTLNALGEPGPALASLTHAARHRAPAQGKAWALTHARLAEARVNLGQLEAACDHWHTFLDHYPYLHSAQVDQALTRLRQRAGAFPRQNRAVSLLHRARGLERPIRPCG
ncbi:regulatory protein [Streptomyces formicae]|uniref:Regulatory protein n=2 Tax=Streptomyces formicae TaxID=1616117 RepID=A0A291Q2B1_9ACTN|nr:regulatory protein [Streptomyces formicae]